MGSKLSMEAFFDQALVLKMMHAIRDPSKWQSVLAHLMDETGAKAAMITLRDAETCQIVEDLALQRTFHSPLIRGFSIESASYYLQELRKVDPWAAAQRNHYPHQPLLMSQICAPSDYPENRFFEWLNGLGMSDTVVFELDRVPGHWTACNIFIDGAEIESAKRVLNFAKQHQALLRQAWQTSQDVQSYSQARRASIDHIEAPACVVNHLFEVLSHNQAFQKLQDSGYAQCFGPRRKLSIADSIPLTFRDGAYDGSVGRHRSDEVGLRALATTFAADPLHNSEERSHLLIVFYGGPNRRIAYGSSESDVAVLTFQERKMLRAVRAGKGIRDAGEQIGVKRSRAFEIWASIKSKLAIPNSHLVRNG